ncbi:MAG TPA: alpha/beta hydrolase [Thermohalobaculum sp.]|nr:alpha/beta hydrolase [Thermohalobaculum sp.]
MKRSLRLRLLSLVLRLVVKTALSLVKKPQAMRAQFERAAGRIFKSPEDANFVPDAIRRSDVDGGNGGLIPALWASRGRPDRHKVILYLHGGAFLAGSIRTHRHLAACLAGAAGVRSVLPEYRLAPEHPFPAALDDAVAVYRHLLATGYEARHIALAGDSAGGGLVFSLLLKIAEHDLPSPACVVAFSPWTDLTMTRGSLRRNARRDMMLPVRRFSEVVSLYLQGAMSTDPLASPVYGEYANPPPTMITATKAGILRDDAVAMADRLRESGGDVVLELWKDMPHAWPYFVGMVVEADTTVERAGRFIARHLGDRSIS